MKVSGNTIWDTRIQGITGVITAKAAHGVELFATATFGPLGGRPPRLVVSSNYKFPIDAAIDRAGKFAINVMPTAQRRLMASLVRLRRRESCKADALGIALITNEYGIPYLEEAAKVIFCQLERSIDAGDRRLLVGKALGIECRLAGGSVMLFNDLLDESRGLGALQRSVRAIVNATGAKEFARKALGRQSGGTLRSLAESTYEIGGATRAEIDQVLSYGVVDTGRRLPLPSLAQKPQAPHPIGVCVAGTGWGAQHAAWIRQVNPAAKLFICGRNAESAQRLASRVNAVGIFKDLEAAAKDPQVDCITLALPHDLHLSAVEVAADAGKHVLVEKPIALTLAEADRMIEIADRARIRLMVAENAYYRPALHVAAREIARGEIGEPLYMLVNGGGPLRPGGWKRDKDRMGGGVLIDIGVHYVRAMRMVMGEPDSVTASRAMQANTKMGGEDSVQLTYSSNLGWETHMLLSWSTYRGTLPDVVIAGDAGTIALWSGKRYLERYPIAPTWKSRLVGAIRPYRLQAMLSSSAHQRKRIRIASRDTSGYLGEMAEFVSAVASNRSPNSTPADGRRDLEIVLKSYAALESGQRCEIAPISENGGG